MNLLAIGCSYRTTPVEVRERLAFNDEQKRRALDLLASRLGHEAVILSTCNRVELYLAPLGRETASDCGEPVIDFLASFHGLNADELRPHLYVHPNQHGVSHLFRVAASLDSMLVGEGQIAGQVKKAYDQALAQEATGPLLNALFPHARRVAKRVRTETGISQGHVSVSGAAVEFVKEVFEHFGDKTVVVIGAGKMGELTLRHLRSLNPKRILVTNRSPDKALQVARGCGGEAVPWDRLDEALARADIVLSTTGAPEPIVTLERYRRIAARRKSGRVVILDIAVPRDFDPRIHDGETCLFNIDDLGKIREATLARRRQHVPQAEAIVEQEAKRFFKDWARRGNGPVIERLTRDLEQKRQEVVKTLLARLNGKLDDADRQYIEGAFRRYQNQILHGPISALSEETHADNTGGHTLLEALRKLFRLQD
jgi:glutamyl-tRNA reductase